MSNPNLTVHATMPDGSLRLYSFSRPWRLPRLFSFACFRESGGRVTLLPLEGATLPPGADLGILDLKLLRVTRADHLGPLEAIYG